MAHAEAHRSRPGRAGQQRTWRGRVRRHRWYVGGAALLLVLLGLTSGARWWWMQNAPEAAAAWRAEAAQEAVAYAAADFEQLEERLLARAEALAEAPETVRGLRAVREGQRPEALVQAPAERPPPARTAFEVYNVMPRLVAWSGFSTPLGSAPSEMAFLETPQAEIVRDEARTALAVWWPVRDGTRAIGVVRVVHHLRVQYPVRNQYLEDYSIEDGWQWATGMPVRLQIGAAPPQDSATVYRPLEEPQGRALGYIAAPLPPAEALVREGAARFGDVMALWGALLLLWLMGGTWAWYRAAGRRAEEAPTRRSGWQEAGRFGLAALAWWGLRYALLALDVPVRWQAPRGPLEPLFDPAHLASSVGAGLMRSTGDLLITGVFALLFALAFADWAARRQGVQAGARRWAWYWKRGGRAEASPPRGGASDGGAPGRGRSMLHVAGAALGMSLLAIGATYALAVAARRAVLDSTLDYFARTGLLPDVLVLVVFCALLLLAVAALLVVAGAGWGALSLAARAEPAVPFPQAAPAVFAAVAGGTIALAYGLTRIEVVVAWPVVVGLLVVGGSLVALGVSRPEASGRLLTLQRLLPLTLLVTALLYPLIYGGMSRQRHDRVLDAAASFSEGRDPRVLFAIDQVLRGMDEAPVLRQVLAAPTPTSAPDAAFDSLAAGRLRGTLLGSIGAYRVQLALYDTSGAQRAQYAASGRLFERGAAASEFGILRDMYRERGLGGIMVEQMTGRRGRDRFQYVGMVPVAGLQAGEPAGWLVARAEPQTVLPEAGTPFPQVLLPSGSDAELYGALALAEFSDGVLVRSLGRDFGRYRLPEEAQQALRTQPTLWRRQAVRGERYLTFYMRQFVRRTPAAGQVPLTRSTVVAVRIPAITTSDHLYYLLRLAVAGLYVAVPCYLLGLALRWQQGRLPAPRTRFRDKVINAFFAVGAVSVVAMGVVGVGVIREEGQRSMQSQLRRQLEQVEEILAAEAQRGEPPYRLVERIELDSLAARVGTDLNLYEDARLIASSRPQLVREQLVDERLPASVYEALYYDGFHFVMNQERIGRFPYLAGYKVLADERGAPRYVLSVPTLPEQERIAEEQARTVAYLFGSLLLLVLIVMLTAALLAGALTRPLARLRAGLKAVGKGEYAQPLPVSTRDEIGELVETFNEMRAQLAESRRKLAQQERETAWGEMARQVAHEIKNPLTPMKLSVQHLQRAYKQLEAPPRRPPAAQDGNGQRGAGHVGAEHDRFRALFERITGTLVEQIEALARIANEFSSFARLPTRMLEPPDLNEVVGEAVALMQEEEAGVEITCRLHPEPLVVEADQEELRRIYINLIKNAIQAMPEGHVGRIEVRTEQAAGGDGASDWAQGVVRDNGAGIPEALRGKIFQPNFSTKNSGTGLGLAIVKKGIEEMDGAVWFETEEDVGTTFWVRLPLVTAKVEAA